MNKRSVLLGVLFVAAGTSGCGDFWRDLTGSKSGVVSVPSGTCTPDPDEVKQVILTPPACNPSTPCPCGSYCSDEVGGLCLVDCQTSAECASGKTCSSYGQCLGPGQMDGGASPDPSCPRNLALLQSPATTARACTTHDECPFGSRCDPQTARCKYDCLGDDNTPCDCLGRVIGDGGAPTIGRNANPTLEVHPALIELHASGTPPSQPAFSPRSVDLTLNASPPAIAGSPNPPVPVLHVAAGKLLQVQCPGGAGFVKECDVTPPAWTSLGGRLTSTAVIQVQSFAEALTPFEASLTTWNVSVTSSGIKAPQTLSVRWVAPALAPSDQWSPYIGAVGGWSGTATVVFQESGVSTSIPIRALGGYDGSLTFFDPTHLLSESGIIKTYLNSNTARTNWYTPNAKFTTGQIVEDTGLGNILQSPDGSALTGEFGATVWSVPSSHWNAKFLVRSDAAVTACSANSCGPQQTCSQGFCTSGAPYTEGGATQITNGFSGAWVPQNVRNALDVFPGISSGGEFKNSWHFQCTSPAVGIGVAGTIQVYGDSGEPLCITNGAISGMNLEYRTDVRGQGPIFFPESGDSQLSDCLQQLKDIPTPTNNAGIPPQPNPLSSWAVLNTHAYLHDENDCIAQGKFLSMLYASERSYEPGRHYLWLLAQWTRLHQFIARQASEEIELDDVLLSSRDASSGKVFPNTSIADVSFEAMLDVLEDGWGLVLAQENANQFGGKLPNMATSTFLDLDYRKDFMASTFLSPNHEQPTSVAPVLLEGLAAHLGLLEKYLKSIDRETTAQKGVGAVAALRTRGIGRVTDGLRIATTIERLALRIHERANEACVVAGCYGIPWEARWGQAQQTLAAAQLTLLNEIRRVITDVNPLGVPEGDLPLFFGDVTGDNSRFFASSDYLLNTWAVPAVAAVHADLEQAQQAWISQRNSVIQDELIQDDRERRLEGIAQQFAQPIIDGCGLAENGGVDPLEVLSNFGPNGTQSPRTCFVTQSPQCANAATPSAIRQTLLDSTSDAAVNFRICLWRDLNSMLRLPFDVAACAQQGATIQINPTTIVCNGLTIDKQALWNDYGLMDLDPTVLHAAEERCQAVLGDHPLGNATLPASCYHGRAGEAMARLIAARSEIDAAVAHLDATQVSYDGQVALCDFDMLAQSEQVAARDSLAAVRASWAQIRKESRDDATWFAAIQGAISGGSAAAAGGPYAAIAGAIAGGILGGLAQDNANDAAAADDNLRLAEAAYSDLLQRNSEQKELIACLNQAATLKATIQADLATMRTRSADGVAAAIALQQELATIAQAAAAGNAAFAREENRTVAPYAFHYWLDEKMDRYRRDFLWAQRLTYLAMRAVEYEFQQSSSLRPVILSARHPDQLEDALRVLQQDQASRSINRRRPEELSVVLSLRDDILRIADHSIAPAGERDFTPAQRFRGRLSQPLCAIYDTEGRWMGQGVRFAVDSLAGESAGVALGSRCAERLWRVTATIQGDAVSPAQPGASIFLLKKNTFASQWCSGLSDGSLMQQASVVPSNNLFKPDDVGASVGDAKDYTTAAVYPWFNIRRTDFYKVDFQQGASEELAGRGLYGDYIILFPRELLDTGFNLDNVEDVLMRFDYLSVDNLRPVAPN